MTDKDREERKPKKQCESCDGTGKCEECSGSGYCGECGGNGDKLEEEIATDFYIEFQSVCQRECDDTLPGDVAKWVMKWINPKE